MKIVRIIARLNIGGPAIHVTLATDELRRRGHHCLLAAGPVPESEGNMEYYAKEHDVAVIRIPDLVRPLSLKKDLLAFWNIFGLLRREKPDVVHTHTAKAGTLGRVAALLAGTPVLVHTFHGNIFEGYFSSAKTQLFLWIERILARFTDRIVTVSASQRLELANKYNIAPLQKIQVVRLGIELEPFLQVQPKNFQMENAQAPLVRASHPKQFPTEQERPAFVIGWVGRFVEVKDPLLFVELARALKSSTPKVKFVMVGDGELRPAIESRIEELGLRGDFTIYGWQSCMAPFYQEMDMLVLTSINEGTPVAVIEAMASGRPFVATNVGGTSDLTCGPVDHHDGFDIHGNGILAHKRDPETLTAAVRILLGSAQRRAEMGTAGRSFVLQIFAKERLAEDLEHLYMAALHPDRVSLPAKTRSVAGDLSKS